MDADEVGPPKRKVNEMYKIEKNIPFGKKKPEDIKSKYPFSKMMDGDSFFVEGDAKKIMAVRIALNYFKKTSIMKHIYKTRKVDNGIRVWCLLKEPK